MFKFEMGITAKDTLTNFTGRVTARAEYLTGCNQYLLKPKHLKEDLSLAESHWFDEEQIEEVQRADKTIPVIKAFIERQNNETADSPESMRSPPGGPQSNPAPRKS